MKVAAILIWFVLAWQSCLVQDPPDLTLAISANMRYASEDLIQLFEEKTSIRCGIVVGSSGKLSAQIIEGAPYDVFLSADQFYPEQLFNRGLTNGPPQTYARGKIAIWSHTPGWDFNDLDDNKVDHLAMANPEHAPYGRAALEYLKNSGLYEKFNQKLVFGESISHADQFVYSGAAEIGITALSSILQPRFSKKASWKVLDETLYSPLDQSLVILKSDRLEISEKFVRFLFSEAAVEILTKHGYHNIPQVVKSL